MYRAAPALLLLLLLPLLHQGVRAEVKVKTKEKKVEPEGDNNRSLAVREEQQKGDVGATDDGEPKQVIRVGPENTQVRLGENVYLCCIVDHQQGKAQWTKDGFALGFNRTVPGYPRYRYVGNETMGEHHLVIRDATLEDEGEYECQVGPTATNEAVWAGANVSVMVPPRKIVMVGWGNGAVVEVMEGTKLKLECLLMHAKPAPSVAWYRNNFRIDPSHHYELIEESEIPKMVSVRSHLVMRTDARDDGHKFSCKAIHPAIVYSRPPLVATINLAVFHPPGRPVISEYHSGEVLKAGENRILVCHVFGGNPSPKVMWFRHGRPQHQIAAAAAASAGPRRGRRDELVTSAHPANQRRASGGVFVSQQVVATREEDGAVYECRVSSELLSRPYTTNVTLTVHYPPERVEVRGPAAVAIGEDFSLTCVTAPSSPAAEISWVIHGTSVSATTTTVTEHAEGGWVTTSRLTRKLIRTEETHELKEAAVECKAKHPSTLAHVRGLHIISILERPGMPVVEVEGDGKVTAGDEISVLCTTQGGNPPPEIKIYKGQQKLDATKLESAGGLSRARARVSVNASDNGQNITCEATNLATATPAVGHTTLDVNFAPWEVKGKVIPREVEAGQMVKVSCETSSSIPPSSITWRFLSSSDRHEETPVPQFHQPTTKHIQGLYGGTVTRSKVRLYVRAEDQGRVLRCEADNGLGLMVTTNVTLNVLHGPVWEMKPLKKYEVPEGGNLTIKAFAQANPGPVSYKWQKGRQELYGETSEDGEGILKLNNIERKQAGNYTVLVSSSKGFVPAFFTISVQYAPDNITVPERVLVDQNETVSIKCRATGNPTPSVSWTRASDENQNSVVLASGQGEVVLTVEGASTADTGVYLCHAANIIGAIHPSFTVLVITQAPATTSAHLNGKDTEYDGEERAIVAGRSWAQVGGAALLDCRVIASPQPAFNWTRADGYKVISGKKYFIHVPQLVDGVAEWSSVLEVKKVELDDLTNFTCFAENALGVHSETYALSQPSHLGSPLTVNVTVLNERSALVQWIDTVETPQPAGYTIRFRTDAYKHYEMVDVPGTNISSWLVEDLLPGAQYSFTLQSYDVHGRPFHTSPTFNVVMSPDGEVYGDGDDDSDVVQRTPEGMPLLMFVLIALTGGALCILNITGALCFLRRRTFFQGIRVGSTHKEPSFEVPSPSFVDQLSLSSADDIPPPDYEVTPPLRRQSVMGTVRRDMYGGSVDDMRRPSRSSRGTPSLAHSSDILTSSSTISAGGDLDLDDIIAPPDDFCNGLMSRRAAPPPPRSALRQARDTWTSLEDGRPITQQVLSHQRSYDLTISHQPSTLGPRPVGQAAAASTFHYSMDSLACPQTPMPTPVLPKVSSQVIYHGQPHLQQQLEQEQYQQYQMQYQQQQQQYQQLHFQYPPPMRRASPPMHQTASPPMHQTASPPMHQTSPPMHQTSPPMHQTASPPMHQTSPPMHQTSPPMHQTASPPMHQTLSPMQQQTSPPMQQQTSPPMHQASPPYDRPLPQQHQQPQHTHDGQYYLQQQQQQQCCYQTSPNEPTTPVTPVPPPYASLDPSTLYSIHPTYYEDGARAGPSYSEWSPTSSGKSDKGHS